MNFAVGDKGFVEKIKKGAGRFVSKLNVKEEPANYGQIEEISENALKWEILDEIWVLELVRFEFFSSISRRYRQGEISGKHLSHVINDWQITISETIRNYSNKRLIRTAHREA